MNRELLERGATTRVTRRTVVATGAKLAYAAPLVAVTMKLTSAGVLADEECSCYADYLSPKPGKLVGGELDTCYVCKADPNNTGEATHTVCGQKTNGSFQVVAGPNGPACACNGNGCKLDGVAVANGAIIACPPASNDNCGGTTQSI